MENRKTISETFELGVFTYKELNTDRTFSFRVVGGYTCDYDCANGDMDEETKKKLCEDAISTIEAFIGLQISKQKYENGKNFSQFCEYLRSGRFVYEIREKLKVYKEDAFWSASVFKIIPVEEAALEIETTPLIEKEIKIVDTSSEQKDGQNKCPKCGSTEISIHPNSGNLRCLYCRYEFEPEKVSALDIDLSKLEGEIYGSGATDIVADTNTVFTFQCESCGAEVVIDASEVVSARCHWCRSVLSLNHQIPNGSIPDMVLPFKITKDIARGEIEKFVRKRKFYAHPRFKEEFTTENIMGVYFPYMLVDINGHVNFKGRGEILTRSYFRGSGEHKKKYYDADLYAVERDFDLVVNDLSVEASKDRLNQKQSSLKTNNVINSIMPFDTENCVKWNANYLKGYSSEKRDMNVDELRSLVEVQSKDVARFSAGETIKEYDRGVSWSQQSFEVKGHQWKSAYLPVWLYSYQSVSGSKKMLHYVALNARTKEIMGSVPLYLPKLIFVSVLVSFLAFFASIFLDFDSNWYFLIAGIVYFISIFIKYRNTNARHRYELETKKEITNLKKKDQFIQSRKGLTSSIMSDSNDKIVNGQSLQSSFIDIFDIKK